MSRLPDNSKNIMNKLSVFVFLVILNTISGTPQIVAPYPNNIVAIEYQSAETTCVVTDTDKNKKPDKIVFVTKGKFGEIKIIPDEGPSGRIYYENKTEDDGRKLFVTLHFNNITTNDDSGNVGYECHGYTGAEKKAYGFTIGVIERNKLPSIEVADNKTVKFGDDVVLKCNLTNIDSSTTITSLIWTKDGKVVHKVPYPYKIQLLKLCRVLRPEDGGLFSCQWITRLRGAKEYSLTGNVRITVEPKFFAKSLTDNVNDVLEGENTTMNCSAKGNPLKTEWKMKLDADQEVKSFDLSATTTTYKFSNLDKLGDHALTIFKTDLSDRGNYYCCITSPNTERNESDVQGCQAFTLKLKEIDIDSSAMLYGLQSSLILLVGLVAWVIPQ